VLGGESGERITVLAELTRNFPQARLIYSGPGEDSDAENMLKKSARLGGDRDRVTMETRSRNTFENAVYSKELIKPNSNERWLLVTAALHLPRAIGCFRRAGFKVEAYPMQYTTRKRIVFENRVRSRLELFVSARCCDEGVDRPCRVSS